MLPRPPGHHAQHSLMDGYCMFNHVAVAARYAQKKHHIQRVLIVDWDVHHGQGIQFTFDQDPSVLYFSIHRYEQGRFWPHLKASNWSTTGFGQGQGYTINVPWNQVGMRDADYIAAFLHILLPVAFEFQPQLVLVAAGFDALQGDPKGEMAATPAGFAQLTHLLMGLAEGKLILSLEGGYNLRPLAEGVSVSLHILLGDPCPMLESPGAPCPSAQASISCTLEALEPFWQFLVRPAETPEEDHVEDDVQEIEEEGPWEPSVLPILTWPLLQARTGLVYDQRMMNHCNVWDSHHPETPQRILRIMHHLEELGLSRRCITLPVRPATEAELLTCHSAEYVERLRATEKMKTRELHREGANFDSIYICPSTFTCAQLATGAACCLVEAVLSGEGGYNLTSISESMAACTHALLGDLPPRLPLLRPPQSGALASITETIQVHQRYWRSLRVTKVEDKEGLTSSKSVTKKVPQQANPGLAKGMTMPKEKVLEVDIRKATSALPAEESTTDQTKPEAANVALTQDQSSETATRRAILDKAPSEETVGEAPVRQATSEVATGGVMMYPTASEEAEGGAELIQTPQVSCTGNQSPSASPVLGATNLLSPSQLTGDPGTLELGGEAPETLEPQALGEESLLGEAAGGQDMADLKLTPRFKDLADINQGILYAVTPLSWCPHLVAVHPMPAASLDVTQPCEDCGTCQENWVCLSCYQVYCSRYINAHMVRHHEASGHPLVLSYVDLSTWCYPCQAYVHHQDLLDVKNITHQKKFGEDMPHVH